MHRIEIDAERTLYLTREYATEIERSLKRESASDEERAKRREEIIKA